MIRPIYLPILLAACLGYAPAAPYSPEGLETTWVQPGGAELQLRVFGDEYYARTETTDGYTVVYNSADNAYHYAVLSADGTTFDLTGAEVGGKPPGGLVKHLELPKAEILKISIAARAALDGDREVQWNRRVESAHKLRAAAQNGVPLPAAEAAEANIQAAPVIGNIKGLTILAQFSNDPKTSGADPVDFPTDRSKIVRFCNEVGYNDDGNSGSVHDYYNDQSLGKLNYTQMVTEVITLPRPRNYYNFSDYPTNKKLRGDASRVLIADAIDVLKGLNFDFSSLTTGANNRVLATNVFFAGPDSGVYARGLWPQQWNLPSPVNVGTASAPMYIYNFQITNNRNSSPVIGTFCHENGHLILGYPDIYSLAGEGVGEHCLMGSGNYLNGGKTPSPINAYFKDLVGWENVTELATDDYLTETLPTTGNVAYRIRKVGLSSEFVIVENRGDGDKWAKYSDDKGIAIWHIDETVSGNINPNKHYEVSLKQADGQRDLERGNNRGDDGDLYDLATPLFSDSTVPTAKWWDGSLSTVRIEVMSAAGASMDVLFGSLPNDTIIVDSPNGGEVIYPGSTFLVTWRASIIGHVKIDLFKGGVLQSVIAADVPDSGKFVWAVDKNLAGSSDYTIRISSLTNAVRAQDFSDSEFSINDTTFPIGGVIPDGWIKPSGAASGWKVTNSISYEGSRCLVNEPLQDGRTAAIAYRSNFKAGTVGFYMKVSSEQDFDFARFYIDDVPQPLGPRSSAKGISGQVDWTYSSFHVTAGSHTFKWTYEKDDSYFGLKDMAWLDGVTLPPTSQEIAVEKPVGVDLIAGHNTSTFPATYLGASTKAQVFTIFNRGNSDLTGMKINMIGKNAGDFQVSPLLKTTLAPGASTTFKVVFKPSGIGARKAVIRILSNDADEGIFAIGLKGHGTPPPPSSSTFASTVLNGSLISGTSSSDAIVWLTGLERRISPIPVTGVNQICGQKFLTLSVAKESGITGIVEVSPNLLDWYSGKNYTTVLVDNAELLKVRDNTPVTPGSKRYIRLK